MGLIKKVRTTAKVVKAVGNTCLNPLCLHVAGSAKCNLSCCKTGKKGKR
jgi:hypothetical protein